MTYMTNDDLKVARALHSQALEELQEYQRLLHDGDPDEVSIARTLQAALAYSLAAQTAATLGSPR